MNLVECPDVTQISVTTTMSTSSTKVPHSEPTSSPTSKTTSSLINITAETKSSITLSGDMSSTMSSTVNGMSFIMIYTSTIIHFVSNILANSVSSVTYVIIIYLS